MVEVAGERQAVVGQENGKRGVKVKGSSSVRVCRKCKEKPRQESRRSAGREEKVERGVQVSSGMRKNVMVQCRTRQKEKGNGVQWCRE